MYFGQKLVLHVEEGIEEIRAFISPPMPMEQQLSQEAAPGKAGGCTVFDNPVGTAPGCAFEADLASMC